MAYSETNMVGKNTDSQDNDENNRQDVPLWEIADRPRGILTEADREFLFGWRDLEGQDRRNARYRIRQRLIASLHDIIALNIWLGNDDIKQVANNEDFPAISISNLIGAAYRLSSARDNSRLYSTFEDAVTDAIRDFELSRIDEDEYPHRVVSVTSDIKIEVDDVDIDSLQHKILTGNATLEDAAIFQQLTESDGDRKSARQIAIKMIADDLGLEYDPDT